MSYSFETEMQVRDYECDIQGIVNNAVYQNYLEHARHEFLHEAGVNFTQLHEEGIDAVVSRIEIDYKAPLTPRDRFVVKVGAHKNGRLRFVFDQEIRRLSDDQLIIKAQVTGVCMARATGRPLPPKQLEEAFLAKGWTFE